MSEPARNRFALDLEDLERQLRGAAQPQRPANAVDPLVELTRIVGQDDPLKDLFAQRGRGPAPARQEPSFAAAEPQTQSAPPAQGAPPAELRGALDEFEALLRRSEPARAAPVAEPVPLPVQPSVPAAHPMPDFDNLVAEAYARQPPPNAEQPRDLDQEAGYAPEARYDDYAYEQQQASAATYQNDARAADNDMPELEPQRSRKGLWTAAALIAVGVIGVGAAMLLRGGPVGTNGQPPVISADAGPTKVAPANPGGAEIPNQNKQIYERAGETPAKQATVVSREEQPVDVQQAARSLPPRVVLAGPGAATADAASGNPLAQAPAAPERSLTPAEPILTPSPPVPGLGEPRRVRTVSIRPDGTPAPAPTANAAYSNGTAPASNGLAAARPQPAVPTTTASAPPPRPRPVEPPKTQERAATPAPATTTSTPVRLASAAPTPAPAATPAPATAAIRSGSGDFAVQLAAPGSESEARATFAALQRKFPEQLGGQAPIVRKTELAGGKTVYRLRVGPYSREDATSMCSQLQSSGGQCFIAKN